MMGKPNVPKMANFMEIDVFVLVACPENSLINSQVRFYDYFYKFLCFNVLFVSVANFQFLAQSIAPFVTVTVYTKCVYTVLLLRKNYSFLGP